MCNNCMYKSKWHAFNRGSPRTLPESAVEGTHLWGKKLKENRPSLMHTVLYLFGYKGPEVCLTSGCISGGSQCVCRWDAQRNSWSKQMGTEKTNKKYPRTKANLCFRSVIPFIKSYYYLKIRINEKYCLLLKIPTSRESEKLLRLCFGFNQIP